MVGLQVLDLAILVRIQVPEPQDLLKKLSRMAKQAGRGGAGWTWLSRFSAFVSLWRYCGGSARSNREVTEAESPSPGANPQPAGIRCTCL